MDHLPAINLPWSTQLPELLEQAIATPEGACCLFAIAESIPREARSGYSALVMAYARENEPVAILDDGSALLLVLEGGTPGAAAVAKRVIAQLSKLGLALTLRAGVVPTSTNGDQILTDARAAADGAAPGDVSISE